MHNGFFTEIYCRKYIFDDITQENDCKQSYHYSA